MSTQKQALTLNKDTFSKAQNFLNLFQQKKTLIKMDADGKHPKIASKSYFKNTVEMYSGDLFSQPFSKEIIRLQNLHYYVWFTPNESDGVIYEHNATQATNDNITHFSACFVDTDEGDIAKLDAFCKKYNVPYHLKVTTSPGRYHTYFLIERIQNTPDNRLMWEAIQRKLMSIDKLYDHSLAKPCQLMRVPFFYHNKGAPQFIKADKIFKGARYTLEELYTKTKASEYVKESGEFTYPTAKIESGSRHERLFAYLNSVSNSVRDPQILHDVALGFAVTNFEEFKEFLPNRPRYGELLKDVRDTIHYRKKEEVKKIKLNFAALESKRENDLFYLPDSFYFDCPNGIGAMVKECTSNADYPCAPVDFAGILSMLGMLKSHLYVTSLGHGPANYFLCLAPTGRGKNHIQRVISKVLEKLYMLKHVQFTLSSEKGLYRAFSDADSKVFAMIDEIEQLLQSVTNERMKSESYQRGLKTALLRMYSSTDKIFKSGLTGNAKDKQYEFKNPHLNLCAFGTPSTLYKGFSTASIQDGFLPRFLIMSVDGERVLNEDATPNYQLSDGHLQFLRQVSLNGNIKREDQLRELDKMRLEIETTDSSTRKKELKLLIGEAESATSFQNIKAAKIKFTSKAEAHYLAFRKDMDACYNKEFEKGSGLGELHTRAGEQVGRLCAVIGFDEIKSDLVEYCITFVKSRIEAQKTLVGEQGGNLSDGVGSSREARDYYALLSWFEKKCTAKTDYLVRRRDIFRSFKWDTFRIDKLIKHMEEAGEIRADVRENKNGVEIIRYQLIKGIF